VGDERCTDGLEKKEMEVWWSTGVSYLEEVALKPLRVRNGNSGDTTRRGGSQRLGKNLKRVAIKPRGCTASYGEGACGDTRSGEGDP